MKSVIPTFCLLPITGIGILFALDETWNTPTSSNPPYSYGFNYEETEGTLTVESNGDVFSDAELELRATIKIIFKPGFRAYNGSTMRAGIDTDLDGFTEADVDEDGIPDQYERKVSGLDEFDPSDAMGIHPTYLIPYYDAYHLNLGHQFISTGSRDFRAPFANDLISDFNFDDNGIIDTTVVEVFGHYNGDGIKDFWLEVEQYDPTWSPPFYVSAYTGFNSFTPFDYRVFDGVGGPITGLIFGTNWGYSSASWSHWVVDSIRYEIVKYGTESEPWEGGSYNQQDSDNIIITPMISEIVTVYSDGTINEIKIPGSVSGRLYGVEVQSKISTYPIDLGGDLKEGINGVLVFSDIFLSNVFDKDQNPVVTIYEIDFGNTPEIAIPSWMINELCKSSSGRALVDLIRINNIPIFTSKTFNRNSPGRGGVHDPKQGTAGVIYINDQATGILVHLQNQHGYSGDLSNLTLVALKHEICHYQKFVARNLQPLTNNKDRLKEEAECRKEADEWAVSAGLDRLYNNDINGDGIIDIKDYNAIVLQSTGDQDMDGDIDFDDYDLAVLRGVGSAVTGRSTGNSVRQLSDTRKLIVKSKRDRKLYKNSEWNCN